MPKTAWHAKGKSGCAHLISGFYVFILARDGADLPRGDRISRSGLRGSMTSAPSQAHGCDAGSRRGVRSAAWGIIDDGICVETESRSEMSPEAAGPRVVCNSLQAHGCVSEIDRAEADVCLGVLATAIYLSIRGTVVGIDRNYESLIPVQDWLLVRQSVSTNQHCKPSEHGKCGRSATIERPVAQGHYGHGSVPNVPR